METHNMVEKKEEPKKEIPFAKTEETKENPEEVETPEEETTVSEQEPKEEKPEVVKEEMVSKKELDKLYARMKSAEEEAKKAKAQLIEKKPVSETDVILEVQVATKGLTPEAVKELQLRAKANGVSLTEARQDENFKLWQDGRKAKVEKEKALNPSTTQSEVEKKQSKSIDQRLQEATTQEEKAKILDELTYKNPVTGDTIVGANPIKSRNS